MSGYKNVIQPTTFEHIKANIKPSDVDLIKGKVVGYTRHLDEDGYVYVNLAGKPVREHAIIGYFIFGERMVGNQINHINGIKQDNLPQNLELCTPSQNAKHAFETGLRTALRGEESGTAKLSEQDVLEIKRLRAEGLTLKDIGDKFGISFQQVSRICRGERRSHIRDTRDEDFVNIDFDKYQQLAKRTANNSLSDFDAIANYALGLVSEAAEVTDEVKKQLFHGHEVNREKIMDEMSDCLWYLANLADKYGLRLKDIAVWNIEKLKKRYPDGFSVENSLNRKED